MFTPEYDAASLLRQDIHFLATLWRIARTDSVTIYLTDHNQKLYYNGVYFRPLGGGGIGADQEQKSSLDAGGTEVWGIISSDAITQEDLNAHKYRGAVITQYLINWMYPWQNPIERTVYIIGDVSWDGHQWRAELLSLSHLLEKQTGEIASKKCTHIFTQGDCGAVPPAVQVYSTSVVEVYSTYNYFKSSAGVDAIPIMSDDFYAEGIIGWTSGLNNGDFSVVATYKTELSTKRNFKLFLDLINPIQVGDTFTIVVPCRKTFSECVVFGQRQRFSGFPDLPGENKLVVGPDTV